MKKNLIGLLAIAGVALTGCNNSTIKVKIFCNRSNLCLKCEPLKEMNLDDYNVVSLECESLVVDEMNYYDHHHYVLTYRE